MGDIKYMRAYYLQLFYDFSCYTIFCKHENNIYNGIKVEKIDIFIYSTLFHQKRQRMRHQKLIINKV